MSSKLISALEELINQNIDKESLPYIKGNTIRIGKYAIRQAKAGWWVVYDIEENLQVAKFFCKTAAIAYAVDKKAKIKTTDVYKLDKVIQKHYNDCVFYKYIISKSKDDVKREIIQNRYEVSYAETKKAKQSLDNIIFSKIG
jgi:hypothetical protein